VTFFSSDIVRTELKEIGFLQQKISSNILSFQQMTREEKLDHIKMLEELLEKQRILYTRLSLSDDSSAIEMKNRLDESMEFLGLSSEIKINDVFKSMIELIEDAKRQLQAE
jgi:hypothetical protein